MGIKNSTLTRVKPLFDKIKDDPEKIDLFLSLMSGYRKVNVDYSEYKVSYGKCEKRLKPPKSLLIWQIENREKLSNPENYGVKKDSPSYSKRKRFFEGDIGLLNEARSLIKQTKVPALAWYIFEGYTVPDIFIETKSHLFVGEAKRTERKLTTRTTWLKERDQLVRHIDAVIDGNKEVLSFFLFSKQEFQNHFSMGIDDYGKPEYVKRFLPHRHYDIIEKVANTFIGYSFWEDLKNIFQVEFPDTI